MSANFSVSRRGVLAAGIAGAGAAVLAACGSSGGPSTGANPAGGNAGGGNAGGGNAGSSGGSSAAGQKVMPLSGVKVGSSASAKVGSDPVLVFRESQSSVVCFSAICTHMGCTVNPTGTKLTCPCHGSVYDAKTGKVLQGPAPSPLPSVGVTVHNGEIVTT